MSRLISISATSPEPDLIEQAAGEIKAGHLIIFPTDTVYGLGADALNEAAVRAVFEVRGRSFSSPLPVLIADPSDVETLVAEVPAVAARLIERFWPGPVTLVFKKSARVPALVTAGQDTVALRVPDHTVARALIKVAGTPVVGPSANLSGRPAPADPAQIETSLSEKVSLVIDSGATPVGRPSTIVDVTSASVKVLRQGAVTEKDIESVIE